MRRKRECSECGGHTFGLIRHYVGFNHLCSRLCKEQFLARKEREWGDRKKHLEFLHRPP